jgi:hypothetical protein
MTGRTESGRQEPRDTLLLYCPYDRRVTRHARRGPEQALVCLECGRPVETVEPEAPESQPAAYEQRTARFTPIVEPAPARRSQARPRPRRTRSGWIPLLVAAVALVVGVLAAVNVAGNLAAPPETTAVPAPPQATRAPNTQGSPPSPNAQTSPAAAQPQTLRIANTGGEGAYIRRTTNLDDRLRAWADNTQLRVIGPDESANGTLWKHVQDPAGNQGWIPAEYTRPE